MSRRKLILATRAAFWRTGAGLHARTASVVRFLSAAHELTVAYFQPFQSADGHFPNVRGLPFRLIALDPVYPLIDAEYARRFGELCASERYEACIVDRIELGYLLDVIPANTRTLLDSQDIASDQADGLRRHGFDPGERPSAEQEFAAFLRFDAVIAIQQREYERIRCVLGEGRTLLVPHPGLAGKKRLRSQAKAIGFVASHWEANVHGLQWFLRDVWSRTLRRGIVLNLYGSIGMAFGSRLCDGIVARGIVPRLDDIYGEIDVAINPVQFGSGLKIKSVEALGNGIPLVTTSEGASGLEDGRGSAFIVADDAEAFSSASRAHRRPRPPAGAWRCRSCVR